MNSKEPLPQPMPHDVMPLGDPYPQIHIMHPALDDILFIFPAYSTGSTTTPYGVFCPLVLDACRVLTNHAANGQSDFLASDRAGRNRIPINDDYMNGDCYYFLGPREVAANRNYPVVKTFSAFTLPSVLPDRWSRVAVPLERRRWPPVPWFYLPGGDMLDPVLSRDVVCTITRYPDSGRRAYLIPPSEEPWFFVNHMQKHLQARGSEGIEWDIHHPGNGILLRPDVHHCLERHGFVFYPNSSFDPSHGTDVGNEAFVTYFVGTGWRYLPELFHRRRVVIHPEIRLEFIYAYFAYTVINLSLTRKNDRIRGIPERPDIAEVRERIRLEEEEEERQRQKTQSGNDSK